jgi:uncharacterized protein (DUF1697 family)
MGRYVALLRAVNVGGTGKLPMTALSELCVAAGFARVETYIASGNVVFDSKAPSATIKAELEARLHKVTGKPVGVIVRTAKEMQAVVDANPFPKAHPSYTHAFFLDEAPDADALKAVSGRDDEELRLGTREIYVHYPKGMGVSKLKIPAAKTGTARNMNTVARLATMAAK